MASLTNTKISDTYPLLLKIETNGVDGTLRSIEDGDGTTSALKISNGAIQVDNIKVDGNAITSTDSNGNIDLTPDGSGEVNISKVDIDSGTIDSVSINATTISASGNVDFNGDLDVDGTTNLDAVDIAGTFAVSHSSDFGSFTSTLQYPILKLNSTYGSAAGNGYLDFQRDGTTAARIYQTNQELRLATGGTSDALTIDSSQNVGIGTTNPVDLLHVGAGADSPAVDSVAIFTHTGTTNVAIRDASQDVELLNYAYSGGGLIGTVTNHTLGIRTNNTNRITILNDGNVGIGETSPSERLHIGGDYADFRLYSRTGIEIGTLAFNEYFNGSAWVNDDSGIVSGAVRFSDSRDSLEFGVRAGGASAGYSSTHMTIKSTGRVGIGTNDPASLLQVKTTANSSESIQIQNDDSLTTIGVSSDGYSFHTYQHSLYIVNWDGSNWLTKARWDSNGNLGIGALSPESQLTFSTQPYTTSADNGIRVQNPDTTADAVIQHYENSDLVDWYMGSNAYVNTSGSQVRYNTSKESAAINISAANGHIFFATSTTGANPTSRMLINNAGNVGIGTASPSEKLEVYDGDILVSSGRGVRANGGQEMIRFNSSDGVLINSGNSLRMQFYRSGEVDLQGVYGENVGSGAGTAVVRVSSGGRLGVDTSSKRFKTNISDIENFNWIQDLRVVDFVWKKDNSKDWGLIAEEVEKIKPELVSMDDDGKPFSVHYDKLTVLLLKQIQELTSKVEALENA